MKYRNVVTGRVLERPASDKWLEASSGWVRVEETRPLDEVLAELDASEAEAEDDTRKEVTE